MPVMQFQIFMITEHWNSFRKYTELILLNAPAIKHFKFYGGKQIYFSTF